MFAKEGEKKTRVHPKVNLPFFKNNRKKIKVFNIKPKHSRDRKISLDKRFDESMTGSSTQETDKNNVLTRSTKRPRHSLNQTGLTHQFNTPTNKLKDNVFETFKKSELLNPNLSRENFKKDNILRNVQNPQFSQGQNLNIQRFLFQRNPSSGKKCLNTTFGERTPSVSVPKERVCLNMLEEKLGQLKLETLNRKPRFSGTDKFTKFQLKDIRGEGIQTNEPSTQSSYRHVSSIISGIDSRLEKSRHNHNNSQLIDYSTLEINTPSNARKGFELPDLSRRSQRRKPLGPLSSARRKLPGCFSITDDYKRKQSRSP